MITPQREYDVASFGMVFNDTINPFAGLGDQSRSPHASDFGVLRFVDFFSDILKVDIPIKVDLESEFIEVVYESGLYKMDWAILDPSLPLSAPNKEQSASLDCARLRCQISYLKRHPRTYNRANQSYLVIFFPFQASYIPSAVSPAWFESPCCG